MDQETERDILTHMRAIQKLAGKTVTVLLGESAQELGDQIFAKAGVMIVRAPAAESDAEFEPSGLAARSAPPASARATVTEAEAPDALPPEALQPSFHQVPLGAVMRVDVAMLTRALRTWDEESSDKGWADRTDEERHVDNARYIMGIMLEHATWPIRDALCQAIEVGALRGISAVEHGGQRLEYATATLGTCDTEIERMVDRLQKTGGSIEIRIEAPTA